MNSKVLCGQTNWCNVCSLYFLYTGHNGICPRWSWPAALRACAQAACPQKEGLSLRRRRIWISGSAISGVRSVWSAWLAQIISFYCWPRCCVHVGCLLVQFKIIAQTTSSLWKRAYWKVQRTASTCWWRSTRRERRILWWWRSTIRSRTWLTILRGGSGLSQSSTWFNH